MKITRREFVKKTGKGLVGAAIGTGLYGSLRNPAFAANKDTIIHATNQEAIILNPLLYHVRGPENVPEALLFDALWDISENGEFVPNLVTKVPSIQNGGISEDGLTWKIELRQDVKWHDGAPFSSKDVEFTYKTLINPDIPVRTRVGMDMIEKFTVHDDYNLELKLKNTFAPYLWVWQSMHIVPEHILGKAKDFAADPYNDHPIGTGPYRFVKRVAGSHQIYEKNENYHRPSSNVKKFIHKFVPTKMGLYNQLKTEELHISTSSLPPERYPESKTLPNLKFELAAGMGTEFCYFNCGKPQFTDPRVRRALYMGFDKDKIINDIYYGLQTRTLSYFYPGHWAYNNNLKDPGYDPKGAAELLDAAGWKVGSSGVREKDGVKLEFSMSTTAGAEAREQAQAVIQQNWKDINVNMEIKNYPSSVVWGKYRTNSEFDTIMIGIQLPLGADPDFTMALHSKSIPVKTGEGANYSQYENAEVDKLLEQGVIEMNKEERIKIYGRIQEIFAEEVPFAPIFDWTDFLGMNKDLVGFKQNVYISDVTWNVHEWDWA